MNGQKRFLLPIGGILLVFLLYSAYWLFMSNQIRREVTAWIATQEEAGYDIEQERLRVTGYPYRFQVSLLAPRIAAPATEGGWRVRLARVSANAMPYDLSHWIVSFRGPLELDDYLEAGSRLILEASDARVSLVYNEYGETVRIGADLQDFTARAVAGPPPAVTEMGQLLLNGEVEETNRLRLRLALHDIVLSPDQLGEDVRRAFGETASLARVDLEVTEWSSLARGGDAIAWSAADGRLEILASELNWGPAHLTGTGDFTLDRRARPDGRLSLHITDPDALADALVAGGIVPRENEQALRLAAMLAPRGPEGVSLPFRVHQGGLYLGPVRLGDVDHNRGLR